MKHANNKTTEETQEISTSVTGEKREVEKFEHTLKGSQHILYRCKSVFPFDFFPDEIIIDENKVDVKHGLFFLSTQTTSIPFEDIVKATTTTGLFFASLVIEMEAYIQQPEPVNYLWQKDAIKARRIINGLVSVKKQGVNLRKIDLINATDEVEEIGVASNNSQKK